LNVKELTPPQRLILTEILAGRLTIGHYKHAEVEKDIARRRAGYRGELALEGYVKQLPENKYFIFHDLQLQIHGVHFQIDTLLLSQYFNLLIEAKNISGTLTFDRVFKQLIRKNADGTEDVFEDPRIQAQYHQILLNRFLRENGMNLLPIERLVFFSSIKTNLKVQPGDNSDFSRVCKAREIFLKIDGFEQTFQHKKVELPKIEELGQLLLSSHSPKQINILNEYGLTTKDIRPGVRCPECKSIPMLYVKGEWRCHSCKHTSKDVQLAAQTVNDYFHIIKPTITNSEFRQFLQLPSNNVSQKNLHSLNLKSTGKTKNRLYFM
jgi:hypothetical protein